MILRIIHKAKDDNARVLLNHTLYGRLVYKQYRGRKHAYYVQGLLDNIKFVKKPSGGECIVFGDVDKDNLLDILSIFGEIEIDEPNFADEELEEYEYNAQTGYEYWKAKADQKKLPMRMRQRRMNDGN